MTDDTLNGQEIGESRPVADRQFIREHGGPGDRRYLAGLPSNRELINRQVNQLRGLPRI